MRWMKPMPQNPEHIARVLIHPTIEPRLAGDEDLGVGVFERIDDLHVDLIEDSFVVEAALDEVGADERRLVVERDDQTVDVLGVVDDAADRVDLVLPLRRAQHDGLGAQGAAGRDAQVADGAVADRLDLVVVDAVDRVHAFRHAEDLRQVVLGEDRALFHLQHDDDVVGAAEGARVLVVHLHELVRLRQQIAEARDELQLEAPVGEERGDRQHDDHHRIAPLDQLVAEPIERALVLGNVVVECHGSPGYGSRSAPSLRSARTRRASEDREKSTQVGRF